MLTFGDKESEVAYLVAMLTNMVALNATDADIIKFILDTYESASVFDAIRFTDRYIYGTWYE